MSHSWWLGRDEMPPYTEVVRTAAVFTEYTEVLGKVGVR
jgi:hypothetical protein